MSERVAVATDSGANLPSSLIEQYDIEVIPLWIQIEDQSYRDGIDIKPLEFFRRLREKVRRVSTSQPSLGEFLALYRRLQQKADAIVSIHVTSRYSGVMAAAQAAAAELAPYPIEVVDTGTISMAQGFAVLAAARAAAAGESLRGVVERVKTVVPKVDLVATLESLEFAVRGGRLAWAGRLLDNLLHVKPLVRVRNNDVGIFGQARTRAKAVRQMVDEIARRVGDAPLHVAVLYSDAIEEAQQVKENILARFRCVEVYMEPIVPVLGAHAGPGSLGLAFYADE